MKNINQKELDKYVEECNAAMDKYGLTINDLPAFPGKDVKILEMIKCIGEEKTKSTISGRDKSLGFGL